MHEHGIMGALWKAARRLVTARQNLRITVGIVLAAAVATGAGAVPVEYDYTGSNFTSVTCLVGDCAANAPTTSQTITGNIVSALTE